MGSHPANLALRFLLELAALVGLGMWGWSMTDGWFKVVLAIAVPVVAAALWGTFAVPEDPSRSGNAPVPTRGWVRLILELAVLGLGSAGFAWSDQSVWAGILGFLVIMHYLLSMDRIRWLLAR